MKRFVLCLVIATVATALFASGDKEGAGAAMQTKYPEKPIEVTCIFGAGSAADIIARKFSDLAQPVLGQPLPVVNRTGGGQAIGYTYAKDAKPDGYNIVWTSNGLMTSYYQGNVNFTHEVFRSIGQVSYEAVSIAVKYDAPWKTINDLVNDIKANPGKIKIGNSGIGTYTHLTAAALENFTQSKVVHVPFGQGLAFASMMGGQIDATVQLPSEVTAQHESKQVRILAVTSKERLKTLQDVPSLYESKIPVEMILWRGLAVPAGTPDDVVAKLEMATKKVVESKEFRDFCDTMNIIPAFKTGKDLDLAMDLETKFLGLLMKQVGMSKR